MLWWPFQGIIFSLNYGLRDHRIWHGYNYTVRRSMWYIPSKVVFLRPILSNKLSNSVFWRFKSKLHLLAGSWYKPSACKFCPVLSCHPKCEKPRYERNKFTSIKISRTVCLIFQNCNFIVSWYYSATNTKIEIMEEMEIFYF